MYAKREKAIAEEALMLEQITKKHKEGINFLTESERMIRELIRKRYTSLNPCIECDFYLCVTCDDKDTEECDGCDAKNVINCTECERYDSDISEVENDYGECIYENGQPEDIIFADNKLLCELPIIFFLNGEMMEASESLDGNLFVRPYRSDRWIFVENIYPEEIENAVERYIISNLKCA